MASGFGAFGGEGRCYKYWMSFKECMANTDEKIVCIPAKDDYLECLHHKKEFSRMNRVEEQKKINAEAAKHPDGQTPH